jgi:hypothetical protein
MKTCPVMEMPSLVLSRKMDETVSPSTEETLPSPPALTTTISL